MNIVCLFVFIICINAQLVPETWTINTSYFEEGGLIPVPRVERCYLWSSLHFAFTYNNGHIISANVSTAGSHPIALDDLAGGELKIEFSYSGELYN